MELIYETQTLSKELIKNKELPEVTRQIIEDFFKQRN